MFTATVLVFGNIGKNKTDITLDLIEHITSGKHRC